jgi:hypothetical protein
MMTLKSNPLPLLGFLAALLPTAQAALFVTGTITPLGASFRYDLTVENTGPDDYVLVTIDAPLGDPLIGPTLTGPAGSQASYDAGLGLLDLVEDTDFFAAGSVAGLFTFESLAGPGEAFSSFNALTPLGGTAAGNLQLRVIPEPAGAGIALALGLLAAAFGFRRKFR